MRKKIWILLASAALLAPSVPARADGEHSEPAAYDFGRVGETHFPVSCLPERQREFDQAVALLHSFFYEESERRFRAFAANDPYCAMAWWGVAMSLWHPLWEPPDTASLRLGREAIERARAAKPATPRESLYVAALACFYRDSDRLDHRTRAIAYTDAMRELHRSFPADTEAAIFYALALNGTLRYEDKTFANQLEAAAILEPIYARHPNHPGVAHYLIHSYDFPPLARRALPMAEHYAEVAPRVPHAQHMPSHIYTRLGMWDGAIASNLAAVEAGAAYMAARNPGAVYYDAVHAWDYLEYAYLQKAEDRKAQRIRDEAEALRLVSHQTGTFFYSMTAVPSRYALERHAWKEAAALELPQGWAWSRYPWAEATLVFARSLGAARSGDREAARAGVARLVEIRDAIVQPNFRFWARQVEAQRRTASAWLALAEGRRDEALAEMQIAAAMEDSVEKRPVTPGPVLPARELLGDLLLELHRPADALAAYEAVLKDSPGRFNGLAGAMRAAREAGRSAAARGYAAKLLALAKDGDGTRPELAAARRLAPAGKK
jgi:hypothetical protein